MNIINDKIIMSFPVLWDGWEMDNIGWIKETTDGVKYLVLTNHGTPYHAPVEELQHRINEYSEVLTQSQLALNYIL